jgi:hypothetical protein
MITLTLYATIVRAGCVDQRAVSIPERAEVSANESEELTRSINPL